MKNYMYDKIFLKQLDKSKEKQVHVRIISLDNEDFPRETLEGKTTGGSINVDGASAVRRTCSLSMSLLENDKIITDNFWCYNNKFKLEIGLTNLINKTYPDIIWFEMGIYVITSFNKSESTNSLTISISGKDKMCRLNGEVSGNLPISTDFGVEDYENEEGKIIIQKLPLDVIIRNAIKQYAQERDENIIINDLDSYAFELLEYRGETPMFLFINPNTNGILSGVTFNSEEKIIFNEKELTLNQLEDEDSFIFYSYVPTADNSYASQITFSGDKEREYNIAKIEYGETIGYHRIPMVYNNDLILNAGDTVTSLLDKIKNMLGDFEYFYNLQGQFIFQKKNTYIQELFSPINSEGAAMPIMYTTPYSYVFEDKKLIVSISHAPNINNIKNDFSIWGTRKSISGVEIPIHARYAIDKKPNKYRTWDGELLTDKIYDWRELIYRMALDYLKHNQETNFFIILEKNNPWFVDGRTGYEQYYSDLQGYWRMLYDPKGDSAEYFQNNEINKYWNKNVYLDPTKLNFWFDFLDVEGELGKYSINKKNPQADIIQINLGLRSKVVNENTIKSIGFKNTPELLFIYPDEDMGTMIQGTSYKPFQVSQDLLDSEVFTRSSQGLSTFDKINELIYTHTTKLETINLTTIPIYYLEPNTRINIVGYGDYTLDKISYQLTYNGTMSISGNKIVEQYY